MVSAGIQILKIDVKELIDLLNKALADEWLAYYQYWIGAKIVVGPMHEEVVKELLEHANDELRHADLLVNRILQLGGTPLLSPEQWYEATNCGYAAPLDPAIKKILEQNIKGEQCAIGVYNKILSIVEGKDPITYQMVTEILKDEIDHEFDLQSLQEDLKGIMG